MANERILKFDMNTAKQVVRDFELSTKIRCLLLDAEGNLLFRSGSEDVCSTLSEIIEQDFNCSAMHGSAVIETLRSGGKYIYSCPMGFAFFASPIMDGGALAGALAAGPVRITDPDDQLRNAQFDVYAGDWDTLCAVREAVLGVPKKDPEELDALARMLFANAVYISDSSNSLIDVSRDVDSRSAVFDYIEYLKNSDGNRVPYPIEKEQELYKAVMRGDQEIAAALLNQILGHVYFYAKDNEEIYIRIQELTVVLIRAVAGSGADVAHVLELSRRYLSELRLLRTQEQLTSWLASSLHNLMKQVADVADSRHSASVTKAIVFMKQKYALNPTLEQVAQYAGYSPSYFSRIFKEDTGMTFSEFLNDIRIQKSKSLLLTSGLSIADISNMLGYNDQSYFCRIFKNATGTTPDRFRKRSRRMDADNEYAISLE